MTPTPSTFTRPISPTERLYLAGQRLAPPFAIQLVIEGAGVIGADALIDAVDKAAAACPGARLVRRGRTWADSGVTPHVEVLDGTLDFTRPQDEPILDRPLGATPGATTEVILLTGESTTTVVFRAFHGVMDAKGLGLWAADVFRVLRGEEPVGAADPTADHSLVDRLGRPGKPTRLLPTYRSPLGKGAPVTGDRKFLLRHRSVPGNATSIVARIAAVLTELAEGPVRLMVPVDLRRHDPQIRSTANLALPLFLDAQPQQSWSEINAQLLVGMVERRELNEMDNGGLAKMPAPLTRTLLRAAHSIGARTGRNLVSAIVSHAGRIDLAAVSAPGFDVTSVRAVPAHTGLVPLTFAVVESGESTEITVSCRAGRGIAERLETLLDRVTEVLGVPAECLPAEFVPAVAGESTPASTETANSLFRRQVLADPGAVAVAAPDGDVTYGELDVRTDAVAAVLRNRGIGPGSIVAVLAGRTVAGVVAQLGILRAGAAFLPLDPKHPRERLNDTLADSGTLLALVEREHASLVDIEALVLEDLPAAADENVEVSVAPSDIAYITYTSGSTGRPKGVLVPHGGVVNYIEAATPWYRLGAATRFANYHTPAADMACAAFFSPLLTGGAVTLVPDDISHVSLRSMLCDSGANTFLITPSLVEVIVRLGMEVPTPRTLIIGGEKLHPVLAAKARTFFGPDAHLLNSYGPTEVSIVCTSHVIEGDPDPAADSIPIGRPGVNTPVFLLDSDQRPVAPGEVGEMYFGGPQVAAEYLGRPELTEERFVRLPGGERTYRTGDLARVLPDGELDFVGRVDQQVKIRGNRVEPGEVQVVIEEFEGVTRAAVLAQRREDTNVLAAYAITSRPVEEPALRAFLATRLPTYMIPAAIHFVDDLPLTANGKLDTQKLSARAVTPIPDQAVDRTSVGEQMPDADPAVAAITAIWAKVLNVDPRLLHGEVDFFVLGGDSLASVEMLAQVSRSVVGPAGEPLFVAQLEGLIHEMTLGRVHTAAIQAREGGTP